MAISVFGIYHSAKSGLPKQVYHPFKSGPGSGLQGWSCKGVQNVLELSWARKSGCEYKGGLPMTRSPKASSTVLCVGIVSEI